MAQKVQFNASVFHEIASAFCDWEGPLAGDKGEKVGAALLAIQGLFRIDQTIMYDLMRADATADQAKELILERVVRAATIQEFGSLKEVTQEAQSLLEAVRREAKGRSVVKKKR